MNQLKANVFIFPLRDVAFTGRDSENIRAKADMSFTLVRDWCTMSRKLIQMFKRKHYKLHRAHGDTQLYHCLHTETILSF